MSLRAELILRGAVWTGDAAQPRAEAVAVRRGIIEAVGATDDVMNIAGPGTEIIDFDGLLIPAFADLHTHFLLGSLALDEVDLRGARGGEDVRQAVLDTVKSAQPGGWITGGYWNDEGWKEQPDRSWLDDIAPANPVILYRHDLHQSLCNEAALAAAGFLDAATDPEGGRIGRFPDGSPNGLVYERAMTIVRSRIPPPETARRRAALRKGFALTASYGITTVADMIEGPDDVDLYFSLARDEYLPCRVELLPPLPQRGVFIRAGMKTGVGVRDAALGPMKGFMDGSLGSRTAHMSEPYADDPSNRGYPLEMADPPEKLLAMMKEAVSAGFACAVHAIGDEANRRLLNLFEQLQRETPAPDLRHRVEHAQHLTDDLIPRFAALGLTASMQPAHLPGDGVYAEKALGERARTSYRISSLLEAGARVMFNTDWPVVGLSPFAGLAAAVTRRTAGGAHPDGWLPEEKIMLEEALRAYTAIPAWARGVEGELGKLAVGYHADMAILDTDLFQCSPEKITETRVLWTWRRGRRVYGGD